MNHVDLHSQVCNIQRNSFGNNFDLNESRLSDGGYRLQIQEYNERIFKIIQTFLKKLEKQSFFQREYDDRPFERSGGDDHGVGSGSTGGKMGYNVCGNTTTIAEERALIHEVVQSAN